MQFLHYHTSICRRLNRPRRQRQLLQLLRLFRTILKYLESGAYDPHVKMLQDLYRERRDISAATLTRLIEETARTLIVRWDEQDAEATAQLAVRAVLSIAGLSWQDVDARLPNVDKGEAPDAR